MPTIRIRADYDADSDGTTKTATGTTLRVGLKAGVAYRTALRFPLDALPSTPDITRVELEVTVKVAGGTQARWNVHPYNHTGLGEPETDTTTNFYSYCSPSLQPTFINDTFLFRCTGRHRLILGLGTDAGSSSGVSTLLTAAKAVTSGPFTLGIHEEGDDDDCCELEALEHDDDGPAELIVTYNETTLIGTLLATLAQRIDRTRYQSSTLTTSSATVPADTSTLHRAGYWDDHWLLLGSGTGIGASRQVGTWTPSVYTLAKAFPAAPTASAAYEMFPFPPDLATRAINESINELFPAFVYLPYEYECLVLRDRTGYYTLPIGRAAANYIGMTWVGEVDWRAEVTEPDWYPVAFERVSDGQIRIVGALPSAAKVLRIRGRQQLTKFDCVDPLTLTEVTEVLYPETQDSPVVELLLTYAEWKLHKWLFKDWDKVPAPGTLPPAMYDKCDYLEKVEIPRLKRLVGRRGRRMSSVRTI